MLHLVYRSYGGENFKSRPSYYSKLLALVSFLQAAEGLEVDIVFLNDGSMPEDRLRLMQRHGRMVQLHSAGLRGSYLAGLKLPRIYSWPTADLVHYSEDDYLYTPLAFQQLVRVADAVPGADYFAVYGSTPTRSVYPQGEHDASYPKGWRQQAPVVVSGQTWVPIVSHTSTFAARVGALHEDMSIFRQCMLAMRHQFFDHETCVVYQGYQPFDWAETMRALALRGDASLLERGRAAALVPFKVALNARAHRRPTRRRLLLGADPNLATHLEIPRLSPGVSWVDVARQSAEWAAARDVTLPASATSG